MTFWKALRWIGSIVFIALIAAIWLLSGPTTGSDGGGTQTLPPAPTIVR